MLGPAIHSRWRLLLRGCAERLDGPASGHGGQQGSERHPALAEAKHSVARTSGTGERRPRSSGPEPNPARPSVASAISTRSWRGRGRAAGPDAALKQRTTAIIGPTLRPRHLRAAARLPGSAGPGRTGSHPPPSVAGHQREEWALCLPDSAPGKPAPCSRRWKESGRASNGAPTSCSAM